MPQLPDVSCLIKVLNPDGTRVHDIVWTPTATVRYVIFNDSNVTAGPLSIVGTLTRDGVKIHPNGASNVVPLQQITLEPGEIWRSEFAVTENDLAHSYVAAMIVDIGIVNNVVEEDEHNNSAKISFAMAGNP